MVSNAGVSLNGYSSIKVYTDNIDKNMLAVTAVVAVSFRALVDGTRVPGSNLTPDVGFLFPSHKFSFKVG